MTELVGFFNELGGRSGSVRDAPPAGTEREALATYLDQGREVMAIGSPGVDPFDPDTYLPVMRGVLTDGEYAWPAELGQLVRRHGIGLPVDFVDHARSHGWLIRAVSDAEVEEAQAAAAAGGFAHEDNPDPDFESDFDFDAGEFRSGP